MKFIKTIVLSAIVLNTLGVKAQESKNQTKVMLSEMQILSANTATSSGTGTLSDFKALAPLYNFPTNFNDYQNAVFFKAPNNTQFSLALGLQFYDKQKETYCKNRTLRIGLSYLTQRHLSNSYNKKTITPYDTFTSSQTGAQILIDSVNRKYYSMNYNSEQLRVELAYLFSTNPEERWSLYTGIGLNAGISLKAYTDILFSEYTETEVHKANGVSSFYSFYSGKLSSGTSNTERINNRGMVATSIYVPLGLNFKIAKRNPFWNRINLMLELRPSLNIFKTIELGILTTTNVQSNLGLKFVF